MKTADEWFDILWKRMKSPAYGGETLMDIIIKIRREAAEEMRDDFVKLLRQKFSGWRGLAEATSAANALPLPGDVS